MELPTNRLKLQAEFAAHLLEGMGTSELAAFFLDSMEDQLDKLTEADFLQEVQTYAPELLEPEA